MKNIWAEGFGMRFLSLVCCILFVVVVSGLSLCFVVFLYVFVCALSSRDEHVCRDDFHV